MEGKGNVVVAVVLVVTVAIILKKKTLPVSSWGHTSNIYIYIDR